jgi:3'(2'),5'-bisphosphate nucleotidase
MRHQIFSALLIFPFIFALPIFSKEEKAPVFSYANELQVAIDTAKEAGDLIMQFWNQNIDLETEMKGASPVTIADLKANEAICKKLLGAFPQYGLITEERWSGEAEQKEKNKTAEWCWVVDPLDGTKSFMAGKKEFGVHIALLQSGRPVLGVNYYPALQTLYLGVDGCGAYKQVKKRKMKRIFSEEKPTAIRPVVSSKKSAFVQSFYAALLGMPITPKMLRKDFKSVGSCGLRLCMIAEGKRNIYASSGESGRVWDYASGSVILKEAGGLISDLKGRPLDFLSEDYRFKTGTLSCGSKDLFEKAVKVMKNVEP